MMREMALPWPVGYAGSQGATKILMDYGAGHVGSWNVLIGADGKVIAGNLKGDELLKKVGEALGSEK